LHFWNKGHLTLTFHEPLGGFLTFPTLKIVENFENLKVDASQKINKMLDLK
jgi:hypothetical protein